jgi:hypothetical protein
VDPFVFGVGLSTLSEFIGKMANILKCCEETITDAPQSEEVFPFVESLAGSAKAYMPVSLSLRLDRAVRFRIVREGKEVQISDSVMATMKNPGLGDLAMNTPRIENDGLYISYNGFISCHPTGSRVSISSSREQT